MRYNSILTVNARRRWAVNITPRPLYLRQTSPVPTEQEAGWAPGPVQTVWLPGCCCKYDKQWAVQEACKFILHCLFQRLGYRYWRQWRRNVQHLLHSEGRRWLHVECEVRWAAGARRLLHLHGKCRYLKHYPLLHGASGGAVGWGSALQVERLRARSPVVSLKFSLT